MQPGERFDRYVVEGVLGEGGMGRVYRATDPRLHRAVALKVVRRRAGRAEGDAGASMRLVREARAAAALNHPNAVAIYDVGEWDGQTFIAMELVDGASLRAYVGDASVPVATRLRWLTDVARALAAAHARDLVHRDIKPSNVMVREDGVVKVLDFGIARRVRFVAARGEGEATLTGDEEAIEFAPAARDEADGPPSRTLATLTEAGAIVGTPLYMAPEQMRGDAVDERADQFAWGVLAYELLCGEKPWGSEPTLTTFADLLSKPPPPLTARAPGVPAQVEAVVLRALAKDRGERFASMQELLAALDADASGAGALAPAARTSGDPGRDPVARTSGDPGRDPAARTSGDPARDPSTRMTATGAAPAPAPRSRRALALGALAVAVLGTIVASRFAGRAPAATPSPSASAATTVTGASAEPTPTSFVGRPPPASTSEAALAAYAKGIALVRDGAFFGARTQLGKAVAADPDLAAAWLRLGVVEYWSSLPTDARTAFQHAEGLRDRLDEHDRAFFDASAIAFRSDPLDWEGYVRALRAAVARFPGDAELAYWLAYAMLRRGAWEDAVAATARALALDPEMGDQYRFRAIALEHLGRFDEAAATADECDARTRTSPECSDIRTELHEQAGDCAAVAADGRAMAMRNPDGRGYTMLAEGLASSDASVDAVNEALAQQLQHTTADDRDFFRVGFGARVAAWSGDFTKAERLFAQQAKMNEGEQQESDHGDDAENFVALYTEEGRASDARRAAEEFLRKRPSWTRELEYSYTDVRDDSVPAMLGAIAAGGGAREDVERQRAAWLAEWGAHVAPADRSYLWLFGWAATVQTADEARAALAALPAYEPLPAWRPRSMTAADEGRTYLLAGDAARALPLLERGARVCRALMQPFERVRAVLTLGLAREATGDRDGACAAYAQVLARWGRAAPRSVTADRARARVAALRCAR